MNEPGTLRSPFLKNPRISSSNISVSRSISAFTLAVVSVSLLFMHLFNLSMLMLRLTQTRLASGHNVLDLSVCPSCYKLVNMIFWKWMNRLWWHLAQKFTGAKLWEKMIQFWGQRVKVKVARRQIIIIIGQFIKRSNTKSHRWCSQLSC